MPKPGPWSNMLSGYFVAAFLAGFFSVIWRRVFLRFFSPFHGLQDIHALPNDPVDDKTARRFIFKAQLDFLWPLKHMHTPCLADPPQTRSYTFFSPISTLSRAGVRGQAKLSSVRSAKCLYRLPIRLATPSGDGIFITQIYTWRENVRVACAAFAGRHVSIHRSFTKLVLPSFRKTSNSTISQHAIPSYHTSLERKLILLLNAINFVSIPPIITDVWIFLKKIKKLTLFLINFLSSYDKIVFS